MKLSDNFEKLPGVYIIKCLRNGKIYVGEAVNIKNRLKRYKKERTQIIGKALDKYGSMNFEVYVEYFPSFKKSDLVDLEEQLIIKFNSLIPNGYNVCSKGVDATGRKHSEETKRKIGMVHKGKTVSDETRKKLSMVGVGRKQSSKTIELKRIKNQKPVYQIDKNTNSVIKEWASIREATDALSNGKNRSGDISRAVRGVRVQTAFGFKWMYKPVD